MRDVFMKMLVIGMFVCRAMVRKEIQAKTMSRQVQRGVIC